jgi:beta-lactamase regulating signal transducer with metallopeptidase domain
MSEAMKLILSLSLSGSILALILFAMKPFIKNRFSKSLQYYIWMVVLLRLVLPLSFEASIINELFYGNRVPVVAAFQGEVQSMTGKAISNSSIPSVQENAENGVYNGDTDHSRYFRDLFSQYTLYLWLLGMIITLALNLAGYVRFRGQLKKANKVPGEEQNRILVTLLNRRKNVKLVRNPYITTPLLIGLLKPCIMIPDIDFTESQLRNILLHELTHLRRFDIGVKWLTMIIASVHWFNPLMYFIKKEINHACELSCDEAVIKNLNTEEKQDYGDTLISVVAEHKYPIGVLQATMCEEKKSLKERLLAIMSHSKKSKLIIMVSVILVGAIIICALFLGAGVGMSKDMPIDSNIDLGGYSLYIKSEGAGKPAVVFESATGETSEYWNQVAVEIQKHTRTVIYDRAGLGKSEKSPYNRTSEQKAVELHALLKKAKIRPPYILVGSEFGVQNLRMFVAKYPKEVSGIIMVDPRSWSKSQKEKYLRLYPNLNEEQYDAQLKQYFEEDSKLNKDGSFEEWLTSSQQVSEYMGSKKNIPLTIIISGIDGAKSSDPLMQAVTEAALEDQLQLAALSSKSKIVESENSFTYMAYYEPKLIIKEIIKMLAQVKN